LQPTGPLGLGHWNITTRGSPRLKENGFHGRLAECPVSVPRNVSSRCRGSTRSAAYPRHGKGRKYWCVGDEQVSAYLSLFTSRPKKAAAGSGKYPRGRDWSQNRLKMVFGARAGFREFPASNWLELWPATDAFGQPAFWALAVATSVPAVRRDPRPLGAGSSASWRRLFNRDSSA